MNPLGPDAALSRGRRMAVLALWLLYVALGALAISRAQFSADLSAFLPQSPDTRQQVLVEQLQSGIAARTLLLGIEGGASAKERADASRTVAAALRQGGHFDQVQNGDASEWGAAGQWLFANRYLLSPAVDAERFTVDGLRDAVSETLSMLGTPAGNALKPLLERDPTGETQRIAEGLIPAAAPRSEEGVWVSRTTDRALVLATTHAAGADLDGQAAAITQLRQAFAPLAAQGLVLRLSGAPLFAVESRDQIKGEATHLAVVGAIVMSTLLLLAFASPRALVIAMVPVVTGVIGGTAAVSLVFGTVHGLTMGFGSTLIGETVDYAIYYLIQARGGRNAGAGWRNWSALHWPTVRLGVLTSVSGFAALVFSGFPGLAQLGVFSVAGLAAAAVATRFVLPVLAPDGAGGRGLRGHMAKFAGVGLRVMPRLRVLLVMLCVGAAALVGWQGRELWRGDLASMSPVSAKSMALDASLRGDLGASDARVLVIAQAATQEDVLVRAERAGGVLDTLVESGVLAGYETVTRVLPSTATQRARAASVPPAEVLRARLDEALQSGPLAPSRLEPFVSEAAAAAALPPLQRADLAKGPLAAMVNGLLFERPGGGWSAMIALHAGPTFDAQKVAVALQGMDQVQVLDVKTELDSLYSHYLREALVQVMVGATLVVLMLAFYLRSAQRLWSVCQPLALAVLLVMGVMAVFKVPMGILHLVGLLLVVAVGSNYALFFDQLQRDGRADENTLASLVLANVTTVVSFGLIALSDIPALSAIGRVVAPGAFLALLLAAAFCRTPPLAGAKS